MMTRCPATKDQRAVLLGDTLVAIVLCRVMRLGAISILKRYVEQQREAAPPPRTRRGFRRGNPDEPRFRSPCTRSANRVPQGMLSHVDVILSPSFEQGRR